MGRNDHRLAGVPHALNGVLKRLDLPIHRLHGPLLQGPRQFHEIRSHRKITALVAYHKPLEGPILLDALHGAGDRLHHALAQRVRLRTKLQQRHALAHIEQARLAGFPQRPPRLQPEGGHVHILFRDGVWCIARTGRNIRRTRARIRTVKPAGPHRIFRPGRRPQPRGVHIVQHPLRTQRIP